MKKVAEISFKTDDYRYIKNKLIQFLSKEKMIDEILERSTEVLNSSSDRDEKLAALVNLRDLQDEMAIKPLITAYLENEDGLIKLNALLGFEEWNKETVNHVLPDLQDERPHLKEKIAKFKKQISNC